MFPISCILTLQLRAWIIKAMYHIDLSKIPFDGPYYFQELEQQYIREHDHAFYEIAVIMSGRG